MWRLGFKESHFVNLVRLGHLSFDSGVYFLTFIRASLVIKSKFLSHAPSPKPMQGMLIEINKNVNLEFKE